MRRTHQERVVSSGVRPEVGTQNQNSVSQLDAFILSPAISQASVAADPAIERRGISFARLPQRWRHRAKQTHFQPTAPLEPNQPLRADWIRAFCRSFLLNFAATVFIIF